MFSLRPELIWRYCISEVYTDYDLIEEQVCQFDADGNVKVESTLLH